MRWPPLQMAGLDVKQQCPIKVYDERRNADWRLSGGSARGGCIDCRIEGCEALAAEHEAQILGYLKSARRSTAC